jgi:hypothetical protein
MQRLGHDLYFKKNMLHNVALGKTTGIAPTLLKESMERGTSIGVTRVVEF